MESNENTMKVIAIGVQRPKEDCRVIQKITGDIAVSFETMAELCFEDDEDDNIIEMVKDMYADGDYENAAMLLRLSFSIAKMYDEADMIGLLGICPKEDAAEVFIRNFIEESPRCTLIEFRREHEELFG